MYLWHQVCPIHVIMLAQSVYFRLASLRNLNVHQSTTNIYYYVLVIAGRCTIQCDIQTGKTIYISQ
jgi:hypothetical protein